MAVDDVVPIVTSADLGRMLPSYQPWGERIARAEDPDGNQLILGRRAADGG